MNADKEELNQTPEAPEDKAPDQDAPELSPEDEALMQRLIKIDEETGLFSLMAEAAKAAQSPEAQKMRESIAETVQALQTPIAEIVKSIHEAFKTIAEVLNSDALVSFRYTLQRMRETLEANRAALEGYVKLSEELQDLSPYMLEELQEERYHDLIRGESIPELLGFINNGFDENGNPTGPVYQELLERAKARKKQIEEAEAAAATDLTRQEKRDRAAELGAILTHAGATAYPAEEEFLDAFSKTSFFKISDEIQDSFDKTGQLNPLIASNMNLPEIPETDSGLLSYITSEVILTYKPETQENNSVKIYLPKFFSDTQIDPRNYSKKRPEGKTDIKELRFQKMLSILAFYDDYLGRFHDGTAYRFMTFESYDPESETVSISTPYLFELRRRLDPQRFTFLARPSIASEPNKAAVEIVGRLLQGLQMRGTKTPDAATYTAKPLRPKKKTITKKEADGTTTTITETFDTVKPVTKQKHPPLFTYHISYKRIIESCPQIRTALQDIQKKGGPNTKALYNTKLKQTFSAAFRILEEETDAPIFYKGMTLHNKYSTGEYILPTKSRLSEEIVITHYGKNKDYKRP